MPSLRFTGTFFLAPCLIASAGFAQANNSSHAGYYRSPSVHGNTVVFASEGDLWSVDLHGGAAHRLTSAPGREANPKISPDGLTVAFSAEYEGPKEVYTIPIEGGLPQRRTWDGSAEPQGWVPDGRLIITTSRYATLPDLQLVILGVHGERTPLPLATGAEAAYSADGKTLFFTRFGRQWSETKRYKGGWAQTLMRFDGRIEGQGEAVPLTADYAGASHNPMVSGTRVYFLSDRDGVQNVWSMDSAGHDLHQESKQKIFDVTSASVSGSTIVYACGADLWSLDLKSGHDEVIPITLISDFDQLREHWVKKPVSYISDFHLAPDGSSAVFTARGQIFTLPAKSGRIVQVAGESDARFRSARFLPDGRSIVSLSTQSGETEFWKFSANGLTDKEKPEQWTRDAKVLRWDGMPSPDGKYLAHTDKDQQLWLFTIATKENKLIGQSMQGDYSNLSWSPDSRWLAFVESAKNQFSQLNVLNVASGEVQPLTSDRYNSIDPAWSSDGKWLYFLSDRALKTTVHAPWGPREPEPHFDRPVKIYEVALTPGLRSPFLPFDELHPESDKAKEQDEKKKEEDKKKKEGKPDDKSKADAKSSEEKPAEEKVPEVKIDFTGIQSRLSEVPAAPGNYDSLQVSEKRLCWLNSTDEAEPKQSLQCLDIDNKGEEADTVMPGVGGYEISLNRKKLIVRKDDDFFILDSDVKGSGLGDSKVLGKAHVDLSRWAFSTTPKDEFRGYFLDAWRLERDYFYDRHMQGLNWVAMRDRYLPLVARVSDRDELNDLIAQMVSELSALHTFVQGGDERKPADQIDLATFGARLRRDDAAGGFVVEHIYQHDPDLPAEAPPFARPESLVSEGETIISVDGTDLLSVVDEGQLLRGKADTQVMLQVKSKGGQLRNVLVKPIKAHQDGNLRYAEWEYMRRRKVESDSAGHIGYIHLRAMGSGDIDRWARDFYPVFDRQGLIIDVRHNQGGNIDSWLLSRLLRQAWFYWQPRIGDPSWNMQYAFRGHIVVLCDAETASDGEAFTEGFKRFKMGTVIGTRTWGGEIWLSGGNVQADGGVATAAEIGVYGPEGKWLIEGHGVDPDVVVDNLPHATYNGEDAQLQAAIKLLSQQIKEEPRPVPSHPQYPDKSFKNQLPTGAAH